jgi:hypothetical protein
MAHAGISVSIAVEIDDGTLDAGGERLDVLHVVAIQIDRNENFHIDILIWFSLPAETAATSRASPQTSKIAAALHQTAQTGANDDTIVGHEDAGHHCSNRRDVPHPLIGNTLFT